MPNVLDVVPWERPAHWWGEDRHGWYVVPVSRSRDSDCLAQSNFRVALDRLGGESPTVEVYRSSHYLCGWTDWLLVHQSDAARLAIADEIAESLRDYPVLDDEDHSLIESEEAKSFWESCDFQERLDLIKDWNKENPKERVSRARAYQSFSQLWKSLELKGVSDNARDFAYRLIEIATQ